MRERERDSWEQVVLPALTRKPVIVELAEMLLARLFEVSDEEATTNDNVIMEISVNQQFTH